MIKRALKKKPKLDISKMKNDPDVVRKHRSALAETGFGDCADCPGCPGKTVLIPVPGDEHKTELKMKCSRGGPTGELVTVEQAKKCDGSKPFVHPERSAHHHHHHHHRSRLIVAEPPEAVPASA